VKSWLPLILGLLALVVGAVWTFQGLGVLQGSVMTGQRLWSIVGPVVAAAGLALIGYGLRARSKRGRRP